MLLGLVKLGSGFLDDFESFHPTIYIADIHLVVFLVHCVYRSLYGRFVLELEIRALNCCTISKELH